MKSKIIGILIKDPELAEWIQSKDVVSDKKIPTPLFDGKELGYRLALDENEELTIELADMALDNFFNLNN